MPQNPSFSELLSGEIVSLIALFRTFEEAPTAEAKTKLFKEHMAALEVEFTENWFEKELEEMKAAAKVVLTRDKENQENGMNITGSTKAIQHLKYYLDKGFGFLPTPSKGLLSGPHALSMSLRAVRELDGEATTAPTPGGSLLFSLLHSDEYKAANDAAYDLSVHGDLDI